MSDPDMTFDAVFEQTVELGNRHAQKYQDVDVWDIADGLLAGAIQFWLYAHQPCGDPRCEECATISTAEGRVAEMQRMIRQFTEESEYYHSPNDVNVGRA